jgi:hypothetical protein
VNVGRRRGEGMEEAGGHWGPLEVDVDRRLIAWPSLVAGMLSDGGVGRDRGVWGILVACLGVFL